MSIFSPSRTRAEAYDFEFNEVGIRVTDGAHKVDWFDSRGSWSGELDDLFELFHRAGIASPDITQSFLEQLWRYWKSGEATNEEVVEAIGCLAEWINSVNDVRPRNRLLGQYF